MRLGKHAANMLKFAQDYKGLHSFAQDRLTRACANRLQKNGLIAINEFNQFEVTTKGFAVNTNTTR